MAEAHSEPRCSVSGRGLSGEWVIDCRSCALLAATPLNSQDVPVGKNAIGGQRRHANEGKIGHWVRSHLASTQLRSPGRPAQATDLDSVSLGGRSRLRGTQRKRLEGFTTLRKDASSAVPAAATSPQFFGGSL